jgi:hypothetical protein
MRTSNPSDRVLVPCGITGKPPTAEGDLQPWLDRQKAALLTMNDGKVMRIDASVGAWALPSQED